MHITLIQCNGLKSNEKFFEKKIVKKTFLLKKFFEKKTNSDKKFFSEIF